MERPVIDNLHLRLPQVSSAQAAKIVGVGYEGFRSYLKRGLLGRVGMLPGFHRPGGDAHDDPAPRQKWRRFGFIDLCLMRTAKLLIDAGVSFEDANSVVSKPEMWKRMAFDREPVDRYVLASPACGIHMIFDRDDIRHLPDRLEEARAHGAFTLVPLGDVQRYVVEMLAREVV